MERFDYERFQAEQEAFFARYAAVREKHLEIFRNADQGLLEQTYGIQQAGDMAVREWERSGIGEPPPAVPDMPPEIKSLLDAYAADIKSALGGTRIYTSLEHPDAGRPLGMLVPGRPVRTARPGLAGAFVFAATGRDVCDYIMRASAGDGFLSASPDRTELGEDPVASFDGDGNASLAWPADVYALDPGPFEAETQLVRDAGGGIVPGPFNHEWICPGPVRPEAVYLADGMDRAYFANVDVSCRHRDLSKASSDAAGRHVRLDDARAFLDGAYRSIEADYPQVCSAGPGLRPTGGMLTRLGDGRYIVTAGTDSLERNAAHGYVRDRDLALAAKTVYHERRHLYQYEKLFKHPGPLGPYELHMAAMEACAMAYEGYNAETYAYRLSETDADREGVKDALSALSDRFTGIDWDKAMVDAFNELDQAFDDAIEAGKPEAPRSRAWIAGKRLESAADIFDRYDRLDELFLIAKHRNPCRGDLDMDARTMARNGWDGKFLDLLEGDGTCSGHGRDREILASVLQGRVFDVEARFPAMADELARIRSEYQVDTDAVRNMRRTAAAQASAGQGRDVPAPDVPGY